MNLLKYNAASYTASRPHFSESSELMAKAVGIFKHLNKAVGPNGPGSLRARFRAWV
jgi:hypothetical protein